MYVFIFLQRIGKHSARALVCVPDVPQNIRHVLIDKTVVRGEKPALYWSKGEGAAFWTAWTEAESHEQ
jgi:hypothetical protein